MTVVLAIITAVLALIGGGILIALKQTGVTDTIDLLCAIRLFVIDLSAELIPLLTVLGGFFCAFRIVKLAVEIADDEKAGGFGSIKIEEVLRPLILLLCINFSPQIIRFTDNICREVIFTSSSLLVSKNDTGMISNAAYINMYEAEYQSLMRDADSVKIAFANSDLARQITRRQNNLKSEYQRIQREDNTDKKCDRFQKLVDGKEATKLRHIIGRDIDEELDDPAIQQSNISNLLPRFLASFADFMYVIYTKMYLILLQLYLTILALCFPFVVCFSILDLWRDNLKNFFPRYINVWFWHLIVCVIMAVHDIVTGFIGQSTVTGLYIFIISLAFIQLIKKTPEIASLIISCVGSSPAISGAGHEAEIMTAVGTNLVKGGANKGADLLSGMGRTGGKVPTPKP